jgi:hypothetical protein
MLCSRDGLTERERPHYGVTRYSFQLLENYRKAMKAVRYLVRETGEPVAYCFSLEKELVNYSSTWRNGGRRMNDGMDVHLRYGPLLVCGRYGSAGVSGCKAGTDGMVTCISNLLMFVKNMYLWRSWKRWTRRFGPGFMGLEPAGVPEN